MGTQSISLNIQNALQIAEQRHEEWLKTHPNGEQEEVCPVCKGTGLKRIFRDIHGNERSYLHRNDPGTYEYLEPCVCTKNIPSQRLINNKSFASIPGLYKDAYMSNFRLDLYNNVEMRQKATSAYNHVAYYINKFAEMYEKGIGLFIWSYSKGCGKTRLACSISNELTKRGYRNKYASASEILSEIQATWGDKSKDEYKIISNYIRPDLLIIDDFGARSGQAWMDEKFFMIIDRRYQDNKPTIITSNHKVDNLPFNDQRISDRINDVDRYVVIEMPNESVRLRSREGSKSTFYQMLEEDRAKGERAKHEGVTND